MVKTELTASQYKLLSRYCEEASRALFISVVIGFILPSVLPSALRPTLYQFFWGMILSLMFLLGAVKLVERGEG